MSLPPFYEQEGAAFVAQPTTRGPWDPKFQHGGPPSALLTGALARLDPGASGFALARVTLSFLRPLPIDRFTVQTRVVHAGRTTQRVQAALMHQGRPVLLAEGVRVRRGPTPTTPRPPTDWPPADSLPPYEFTFFTQPMAYHRAIDLRIAGGTWGQTPVRFWARPRVPLVQGRPTLPEEQVVILADAQSGMGVPMDPKAHTFVNPDLTVYLFRRPQGAWIGLDIRSDSGPEGAGLARADLVDPAGPFGLSAQALVVRPR